MPIEPVSRIVARIKIAPPSRPISVFVMQKGKHRVLDAIYGNTIEAKRRQIARMPYHPSHKCTTCGHIESPLAEEWIGDFHQLMNLNEVREFLIKATES